VVALYHGKLLLIARAAETVEREPTYRPTDDSRTAQDAHLARLKAVERYPGCTFTSPDSLAKYVLGGAVLDLLVQAYAEETGRERDAAEGFISEMALTATSILKARNKRSATPSTFTSERFLGGKLRPISAPLWTKRWQERGRWWMLGSRVWHKPRCAGRLRQCAARRRNVANDMSRG
jgi:hypothetical protein